jgi:hypothetical protein
MNESNISTGYLIHSFIQRLGAQSASCKLWSICIGMFALAGCFLAGTAFLWLLTPAFMLALADAGYAAQAASLCRNAHRILSGSGKDSEKFSQLMQLQSSAWGFQGALNGLMGLASFTVWPFYLALAGVVMTVGLVVVGPQAQKRGQIVPFRPEVTTYPGRQVAPLPLSVAPGGRLATNGLPPKSTVLAPSGQSGSKTIPGQAPRSVIQGVPSGSQPNQPLRPSLTPTLQARQSNAPNAPPNVTPQLPQALPPGKQPPPTATYRVARPPTLGNNAVPAAPVNPASTLVPAPVPSAAPSVQLPPPSPPAPLKPEASASNKPPGSP